MRLQHRTTTPTVLACVSLLATTTAAAAVSSRSSSSLVCTTDSQPNPISNQYPNDATGTINGTTAIIPIPYATARKLIPSQYPILTHVYEALLPNLPKGMYPAVLETDLDHDVGQGDLINIPDFQKAGLKFPFVDRLNNGHSSFKYFGAQLISAQPVALVGATAYSPTYLGLFDPSCNPYTLGANGESRSKAYKAPDTEALGSKPSFDLTFKPNSGIPYSIEIFENLLNQPQFGSTLPVCDNYIVLFNTSVTQGAFAPVPVKGTVSVRAPFYDSDQTFPDVWGYRMDNAFIERNFVDCSTLG